MNKHPRNDRQVSFSGGFRGAKEWRRKPEEKVSLKIKLMLALVVTFVLLVPHLVKLFR